MSKYKRSRKDYVLIVYLEYLEYIYTTIYVYHSLVLFQC